MNKATSQGRRFPGLDGLLFDHLLWLANGRGGNMDAALRIRWTPPMALPWNLTAIFACTCASYCAVRRLFLRCKRYCASRSAPHALAKSAAAANN